MKSLFFVLSIIMALSLSACVTNVEGQRTDSKAVAIMATDDIELIVDTGEKLPLFSKADREVLAWAGQSFTVSVSNKGAGGEWKIDKITNTDVVMFEKEMKYEKEWVFTFKALEKGESRIVLFVPDNASGKALKYEIVDVNVE